MAISSLLSGSEESGAGGGAVGSVGGPGSSSVGDIASGGFGSVASSDGGFAVSSSDKSGLDRYTYNGTSHVKSSMNGFGAFKVNKWYNQPNYQMHFDWPTSLADNDAGEIAKQAAEPRYSSEKSEFLSSVRSKLENRMNQYHEKTKVEKRTEAHNTLLAKHSSRAKLLVNYANAELHTRALSHVLSGEESVYLEERQRMKRLEANSKRRDQRRLQKQRMALAEKADKIARGEIEAPEGEEQRIASLIASTKRKPGPKPKKEREEYEMLLDELELATTPDSQGAPETPATGKGKSKSKTKGKSLSSTGTGSTATPKSHKRKSTDTGGDDQTPSDKKTKLANGSAAVSAAAGTPKTKGEKAAERAAEKAAAKAAKDAAKQAEKAAKEEQKAADKAAAAAAAAAAEQTKGPSQKEIKAVARLYQNTYESIWKDMARRDSGKVYRLMQSSTNMKLSNVKKTAMLAAKEARRWQLKTNKSAKDIPARARRGMREMLTFWKRNEKEERDLRRKAEKEAIEQAKKDEELRESKRQAKKLNFLITQTELYSHFIGRKIKTAEAAGEEVNQDDDPHGIKQLESGDSAGRVEDIDFDNTDDNEIKRIAMNNAQKAVMDAQTKARNFNNSAEIKNVDIDDDDMNFQNPTSLGDEVIAQPKMLSCQLKEYQLKGLTWLANLYEQGINGILADEMGLGKTVQSISVMAYLAETHNIWGPFLVIAPASTLHNWQQEISKFVPQFKALPYWGSGKDRKVLRKFWDRKQVTYTKDSPFHVLITSYQLVVADAQYFQRFKWQYMILDEAQAIKSSSSTRWKSLLSFRCRNRLLLTGTPIQNSMQELWALLHFIMPSLFDSHEEFSEWFSKDIESHAQNNSQLNEQQLKRLHMILKPFMLRRVKKHVQQELGDKIEIDVYCNLTSRQRVLYKMLRSQISLMDLIERATSSSDDGTQSLMNLVMQFRKVCNHPDLFERADVKSAFNFATFAQTVNVNRDGPVIDVAYTAVNHISYSVPKLAYRDGGFLDIPSQGNYRVGFNQKYLKNKFSVWDPSNILESSADPNGAFTWSRFVGKSAGEIAKLSQQGVYERAIAGYSIAEKIHHEALVQQIYDEQEPDNSYVPGSKLFLIDDRYGHVEQLKSRASLGDGPLHELLSIADNVEIDNYYHVSEKAYDSRVLCPPISLVGSDMGLVNDQQSTLFNLSVRSTLDPLTLDQEWDLLQHGVKPGDFPASNLYPKERNTRAGYTSIRMPSMAKFVYESGKLLKLDQLLTELKANDHRVLIYFQMTKMMDLMEEYLTYRQYKYCRLDGSSKLSDRRDLVNDWQTRPDLFVFLLSTRAGGLGINLTAADTVIFYDSDWNPTIDSQAMDRAHRLGQTRQVTVYRLLVKGTIEERMRDRAKQKMHVQAVVMEGGGAAGSGVDFQKPGREVAFWLLDDDDAVDAALRQKEREKQLSEIKTSKKSRKSAGTGTGTGSNGTPAPIAAPVPRKQITLEDMYHEDEGNFDESSRPATGATTPVARGETPPVFKPKKRMTTEQRLRAVGDIA
ncbi:chromatin-remodeling ATPase INO80 [Sugiyamaella lignohabitans]|uniref:Chromatin-remodeling ATPase INO80 n=1 Tax=Sugiyamaella lignohabitans TaxID=796027 RepID=A0A167CPE9_9ASCO|nr:chromatin-remodeling ATPase INO80 [Sugiyamaella lignohabitans]ANB11951.1 chromatin-remodeling ATPase INO80 [Sugiyamaella lignohabitans]